MKKSVKNLVMAAMLAAICFVVTAMIKLPSPLGGYINIGDSVVLFAGLFISPVYAFFAAGIGSALADILSGYIIYAPATFVIKGIMALIAYFCYKALVKKTTPFKSRLACGALAELFMVAGYYVFEGFIYGFVPSLVNIPANMVQGVVSLVIVILFTKLLKK